MAGSGRYDRSRISDCTLLSTQLPSNDSWVWNCPSYVCLRHPPPHKLLPTLSLHSLPLFSFFCPCIASESLQNGCTGDWDWATIFGKLLKALKNHILVVATTPDQSRHHRVPRLWSDADWVTLTQGQAVSVVFSAAENWEFIVFDWKEWNINTCMACGLKMTQKLTEVDSRQLIPRDAFYFQHFIQPLSNGIQLRVQTGNLL